MKRLCVVLALASCLCLGGCATTEADEPNVAKFWGKYIVIRELDNVEYGYLYETYDEETHIRYDIWWSQHKGSITPVYNADGTPMVYKN